MSLAVLVIMAGYGLVSAQPQALNVASAQDVISFLNQSIDWYRQLAIEDQIAGDPSEGEIAGFPHGTVNCYC